MSWIAVGSVVLGVASKNASDTSAKAHGGKDTSGGLLGKAGAALGAASGGGDQGLTAADGTLADNVAKGGTGGFSIGGQQYFYGGETVSQIKKAHPVNIVESSKPIQSKDGKVFYNNVVIPRKKV